MQPLTIALGNYGITKPIKKAGADLGRLNLNFVEVEQIVPMMRRMCRGLEFDICEMAFTTYRVRPRGRPAVHRDPGVRDPEFPPLGDVREHQVRRQEAEGPGRPQGRRQPRLHGHHRAVGARRAAKRIRRRPEQDHLDSDRRRARRRDSSSPPMSTTGFAARRCSTCCCRARSTPRSARSRSTRRKSSRSFPTRATPRSAISARPGSIRSTTAWWSRIRVLKDAPWIADELCRAFENGESANT